MAKARRKKRQEIVGARVTTYPDTGQTKVWIEWGDGSSTSGSPDNAHMQALVKRAEREGIRVKYGLFGSER